MQRNSPTYRPPILPTHSKLLQKRWDSAYYDEHKRRLSTARPQVDTRPPKTYMHLHLKLKKLQMEEERLATIERDNRILLTKMSEVMKAPSKKYSTEPPDKSLNREWRVRELTRITKENHEILGRITSSRTLYDHNVYAREWEINKQLMTQISRFPPDMSTSSSSSQNTSRASGRRTKTSESPSRINSSAQATPVLA